MHCVETLTCLFVVVFMLSGDGQFVIRFLLYHLSPEQKTGTVLLMVSADAVPPGNPVNDVELSSGIIIFVIVIII